ncbi:peptidoglycan DD-metalloendopeptidase family protein [Desulfobotulus sp. H1]|uniref:Peptidoglycan DD-metalloendopeptidase family protein n=1 Tax=Desulfobotulus pelophilus TaxID=2823377 RepID=A0ABT3N994_9BACT|nr:peptidoglycan DD-metalloendopeptidase family protein [Desulfobotulus pelophilus]MCW7754024.1 peptidoglycan DD-metalloendopeptidase family protein [Desulfobotulus pelophilus]
MRAWVCFFILCLLMGSGEAEARQMVRVEVDRLNLRRAPDRNAPVIMVLSRGEQVPVLEEKDGWVRVAVGTREGYLRDRAIYIQRIAAREDREMESARQEREAVASRIREQQSLLSRYRERETDVIAGLNAIDRTLNEVNARLQAIRREQDGLLEQRKATREAMARLERENLEKKDMVGRRLTALYKLEGTGRMALLTSTDTIYGFSVHKKALEKVLQLDDRILAEQARRIEELTLLATRLKNEEQRIADAAQRAADQQRIQRAEKQKRESLLADIRSKQKHGLAAVAALEEVKVKLDQTVEKLARRRVAPSQPSGPFIKFKGLLDMPVNGTIISRFGYKRNPELNVQTFQSGIGIRADRGEPIRALFSGTVIYADWFSGYGNMLIIDHGDHYYSVYAHAEELFKKTGDGVERNEVIATVGDAGSLSGSMLHFEIRQQGKPVDPMLWVKSG